MDVIGKIKVIYETQKISDRFSKREFVLTVDENSTYPQYVTFQLTQDRCSLLDNFPIGSEVRVYFYLKGREWKNPEGHIRYFNTLEAWKIERTGETLPAEVSTIFNNIPNTHPYPTTSTPNTSSNHSKSSNFPDQEKPVYDNSGINDLPF